jgi:DNA-binding CsgD family transcriptional regulator
MAERCRIILRCADGRTSKAVAAELGVHEHTSASGGAGSPRTA